MAAAGDIPRPSKLWKGLSEEKRLAAAAAFWEDEHAMVEQAEVIGVLAKQIHFRPKSVVTLPAERKARLLARLTTPSDPVAGRLLVAYHLAHQRSMMRAFLDGAGVPNEDGLIGEEAPIPVREQVLAAGKALFERFPAEDVRLYFATLLLQDPDTWAGLGELLQEHAQR